MNYDLIVIGGGAAGFFTAINAAEKHKNLKICILERGKDILQKVRVSGGGRCNVTHACFDAETLTNFYPRGGKELLEPFKKFNPTHTTEWFKKRNVQLKTEADGRMFPTSDSSHTIIDCFYDEARKNKVETITNCRVENIDYQQNKWIVSANNHREFRSPKLVLATGSDTAFWRLIEKLDITVVPPVPSLFTFNIKDTRIDDLMGLSVLNAECKILNSDLSANGPLLITHWGLSGPAILKLSAWGARLLADKDYKFKISVNWLADKSTQEIQNHLHSLISSQPKRNVIANNEFGIPIRLWKKLCEAAEVKEFQKWAETGKKHIQKLTDQLTKCVFEVNGKSTFKEEFVTAGGIDLAEINFETFSLKKHPSLFVAGEVLNIDAVTGGFNFQAAWTGGWIISESV